MRKNTIIVLLLVVIVLTALYDAVVFIDILRTADMPYRKFALIGTSLGVVICIFMGIYVWRQKDCKRR